MRVPEVASLHWAGPQNAARTGRGQGEVCRNGNRATLYLFGPNLASTTLSPMLSHVTNAFACDCMRSEYFHVYFPSIFARFMRHEDCLPNWRTHRPVFKTINVKV